MCSGQRCSIGSRYRKNSLASASDDGRLRERYRGSERIQIDIIKLFFRQQSVHIAVGSNAVAEIIQFDIGFNIGHCIGTDIVGRNGCSWNFIGDAHGSGSGGSHTIDNGQVTLLST